jgi:hypothetical protein
MLTLEEAPEAHAEERAEQDNQRQDLSTYVHINRLHPH